MRAHRLVPHLKDDPDEWRPWYDNTPRLRLNQDSRLNSIRHGFYEEAISARVEQGRQVRVTTYVLAPRGADAEGVHAALAAHAESLGWRIGAERFTDVPANGRDDARPAFSAACRYAASGFVDGVLTLDRAMVTPNHEAYEAYLRWLHDRLSFLAFVPPASPNTSQLAEAHRPGEPGWPGNHLPR